MTTRFNQKTFKTYNKFIKDHTKDTMKEKTYAGYLGDAVSFISSVAMTNLKTVSSRKRIKLLLEENFDAVTFALRSSATNKTSDSWRKARRSLEIAYKAAGLSKQAEKIRKISNPVPVSQRSHNTKKSRRLIKVTDEILSSLSSYLRDAGDEDSLKLITLVKNLGIRPCEVAKLELIEADGKSIKVKIYSGKKTLIGEKMKYRSRGLDRVLTVKHDSELLSAIKSSSQFDDKRIKNAQGRISTINKKLYPDKDRRFCLYSLRYTFGSNLKRQLYESGEGRIIAAAIMGHKNTSSISSYGHYRSGSVGARIPKVDVETVAKVKDDIANRFGKNRGEKFDVGEAINNRDYMRPSHEYTL